MQRVSAMRMVLLLVSLVGSSAYGATYYVYDGKLALGRRFGATGVRRAGDLAFAPLNANGQDVVRQLAQLSHHRAYRCRLDGHVVLEGVDARTGAMLSRFRVERVRACRAVSFRTLLAAHRVAKG